MVTGLDCYEKWGDPHTVWDEGKYLHTWHVPEWAWSRIPALPRRIYCNHQMLVPLETSFYNVIDRELTHKIKTWDGCFLVRPIRGNEKLVEKFMKSGQVEKAMIYMSLHSWGIAIDINAGWNPLGQKGEMTEELAGCFQDAGLKWGREFKRKDPMHFQLDYIS